jgi:signal transduction histidine kinase
MVDGFDSRLYPVFAVLILHNALAIPLALPQLLLNLLVTLGYIAGGVLDQTLVSGDPDSMRQVVAYINTLFHQSLVAGDPGPETRTENPVERVLVLVIWAACCYGIQVLFEKQKRAEAEATEFAVRQERLRTAGRLAAEIAHKIKNPLGIITNAAFCLQRAINEGQFSVEEQVAIIREEVSRADEILTELMGYAQLAEGRVERLEVAEEIDDALLQVFPPAAKYEVRIKRYYASDLPAILMQRQHLSSVLVNLLQNAREALNGRGEIEVATRYGQNDSIIITIADNGPGIAPDKIGKIFEAYFTTRAKGTGLGLAIVKHNAEMYGGAVKVQSEPGKGSRFTLEFPSRILMKLNP